MKEAIGLFQKVGDRASEAYALGLMANIYVDLKNDQGDGETPAAALDRKSTRLNSSHRR